MNALNNEKKLRLSFDNKNEIYEILDSENKITEEYIIPIGSLWVDFSFCDLFPALDIFDECKRKLFYDHSCKLSFSEIKKLQQIHLFFYFYYLLEFSEDFDDICTLDHYKGISGQFIFYYMNYDRNYSMNQKERLANFLNHSNLGTLYNGAINLSTDIFLNKFDKAKIKYYYYPESFYSLLNILMSNYIERNIYSRICMNCGREFILDKPRTAKFCSRVYLNTNKTCRQIGPTKNAIIKKSNDHVYKLYKKYYRRKHYRYKKGMLSSESFDTWNKKALKMRKQCSNNDLSLEDFKIWLQNH